MDALAAAYEKWRAGTLGQITDAIERDLITALVGDVRGRIVLDVGCGDGGLAVTLAARGAKVTGVDVSPQSITAARARARRAGVEVAFDVADAQDLPFRTGAFDMVTAVTVLCFVDNPEKVLGEVARVLRPGGRLVMGELGRWNAWAATRRIRGWLGNPIWRRARFRSAAALRAAATFAGLTVERIHGAVYYPPLAIAARLLGPLDRRIARMTTCGAAFLALVATKPA